MHSDRCSTRFRPILSAVSPVAPSTACGSSRALPDVARHCVDPRLEERGREFLARLADPDARRSLALRARVDRIHAIEDPEERAYVLGTPVDIVCPAPRPSDVDGSNRSRKQHDSDDDPAGAAPSLLDTWGITDPAASHPVNPAVSSSESCCFLDRFDPSTSETAAGPPIEYLADVERETADYRERRARRFEKAARAAGRGMRLTPDDEEVPREEDSRDIRERAARWHRGRAAGARERFFRTVECGKQRVSIRCACCGHRNEVPARCASQRLCTSCRESGRKKRLKRASHAIQRVLKGALRAGLLKRRPGGHWSQRMVTLTVPRDLLSDRWEVESLASPAPVSIRIDALFRAWKHFRLLFNAWAREVDGDPRRRVDFRAPRKKSRRTTRVELYRAFEWTKGDDGMGHPHFHVWIFSPFLDHDLVRIWWRTALEKIGRLAPRLRAARVRECVSRAVDVDAGTCAAPKARARRAHRLVVARPVEKVCRRRSHVYLENRRHAALQRCRRPVDVIVDVRQGDTRGILQEALKGRLTLATENGERTTRYFEGWSIADAYSDSAGGIEPDVLARLYEALDGRRLTQASRGLLDPLRVGCGECGVLNAARVEVIDPRVEARPVGRCDFHEVDCRGPPLAAS